MQQHPDWVPSEANSADETSESEASTQAESGPSEDGTTATGDGDGDGHVLFVSNQSWLGQFGTLAAADTLCEEEAALAGLAPGWKALISDSTQDAASRLTITGPIFNTQDELVAQDAADLWDTELLSAVAYTQFGTETGTGAWTGSDPDGSVNAFNCDDWNPANGQAKGIVGDVGVANSYWIESDWQFCEVELRGLYCLSQ